MYKIIIVGGNDALNFLQGQFTQDVGGLAAGKLLPAAWCNAQGRVVATLRLVAKGAATGDTFGISVPESIAEAALARLRMYRLRAKVDIEFAGAEWQVFATRASTGIGDAETEGVGFIDIHGANPVVEIMAEANSAYHAGVDALPRLEDDEWKTARIAAGLVDIAAENTALYTPHMLNLDRVGAISFRKGCYTGQEVVARTEHLGRSKRRTLRFTSGAPDLVIGDKLQDGDTDSGVVVNVYGRELLAVCPVTVADKALTIRGHAATPQPLPYSLT